MEMSNLLVFGHTKTPMTQSDVASTYANYSSLARSSAKFDKKHGFTLAEVLITLAIIGVVAAMTIPTLIDKINNKVNTNQKAVIEKRLVQGLNLYNTQENGLSGKQHNSTYDFLQGLSKHFKMTSICDTEHITDCYPYAELKAKDGNGQLQSVAVSSITKASDMGLKDDDYYAPAAFITGSGVPFIVSLKKDCMEDPDQPITGYSQCVDGIYDMSGSRAPNIVGTDVQTIRNARMFGCAFTIGSGSNAVCLVTKAFHPTSTEAAAAKEACPGIVANGKFTDTDGKEYSISGVTKCPATTNNWSGDYWLASRMACVKQGLDLPTQAQLQTMANDIYGQNVGTYTGFSSDDYRQEQVKAAKTKYGLDWLGSASDSNPWFHVWSRLEYPSDDHYAYGWAFRCSYTGWYGDYRDNGLIQAFCVGAN